ncbi:hypothetical protein [Ligilactobacillus ruminis]|mgnify:FL=1|jgi:hypothetical protein|uniref:hypothetical protein n=1 Tax=Ligilactobacillus ruminis TaxID=1623 RepID=UPI001898084B|nr:hypothetical protein [Ligilactobacillus ruminis]
MLIYYYDENNIYTHTDLIDDGGTLPQNATTVAPVDSNGVGLYEPVTWHVDTQTWSGATKEEYDAAHPADTVAVTPTADQQARAQQMLAMANLTNQVAMLQKTVATLMVQNADSKEEMKNV